MTDLVIELILRSASSPQLVARVGVDAGMIDVERGGGVLQPGFDLSEHINSRGEPVPRFGPPGTHERALYTSPTYVLRHDWLANASPRSANAGSR